jgi:hypothetical protein
MDPNRFDQLSKRVATGRFSRRRAVRGLGAAGVASTLFALRREPVAADCPDAWMHCDLPHQLGGYTDEGAVGYSGQCWNWSTVSCELCPGASDAATRRCNETYPACGGRCVASIFYR